MKRAAEVGLKIDVLVDSEHWRQARAASAVVRREDKPFNDHLAHLAVHGFLHLLGFDHRSDAQARRMESAERAILRGLAVPDPYATTRSTREQFGRKPAKLPSTERARAARNA